VSEAAMKKIGGGGGGGRKSSFSRDHSGASDLATSRHSDEISNETRQSAISHATSGHAKAMMTAWGSNLPIYS